MFKFKKGQLVEVIKSRKGINIGKRFVVDVMANNKFSVNGILKAGENCYESNIPAAEAGEYQWSTELHLKAVNPDIDDVSDISFVELLKEINSSLVTKSGIE